MRIKYGFYKFLLKRICDLEKQCALKDDTIAHLIRENHLLSTAVVMANESKLTATDLQRFRDVCNLDFPATTKEC